MRMYVRVLMQHLQDVSTRTINRPSQVNIRTYDVIVVPPNISNRHCDRYYCAFYCQQLEDHWSKIAARWSIYPVVRVDDVRCHVRGLHCWVRTAVGSDSTRVYLRKC